MRKVLILILLPLFFSQTIKSQDYDEKLKLSNGYYRVSKGGKFGFLNDKEKEITKIIYDNCSDFTARGFANVSLANKMGTINLEGKEIVPLKFLKVYPCSKIDLFITLTTDSLYGVYTAKGKELFTNSYNYISSFNKFGVAFHQRGKEYGMLYESGVNSGNTFEQIYKETNGFFLYETKFYKGLQYDYIDSTGKINYNYYDDAYDFNTDRWAVVAKKKKYGSINAKMELIIPYEYDLLHAFKRDTAFAIKNGIPGKINRQNKFTPSENITNGKTYKADKVFGLKPTKIGNLWGFLDKDNKLAIPFIYEDVNLFTSTGFASVKKNGEWGVIDTKNNEVLEFTYDFIGYSQDSTCYTKEGMGISIMNFFTKQNVIKPGYSLKSVEGFENGLYNVTLLNGEKATMTQSGFVISESDIAKKKAEEFANKWKIAEKARNIPSIKTTPNFLSLTTSITGLSIPKSRVGHKCNYPYGTNDIVKGKSGLISIGGHQDKPWIDNDTLKKFWIGRHKEIKDYYSNLSFENFETGGPPMLKMAIENEAEDIVACYFAGFRHFKKTNNTYKYETGKNTDFTLFSLIDIKNNKVAAIGSSDYDYNNKEYVDLHLLIWDYEKNELKTHLISAYQTNERAKLINTNDGNALIAWTEANELTLEKIDINKTLANGKIVSLWKKSYPEPGDNLLSDIIEDRSGNFALALRGSPKTAYFTDEKKTKCQYAHVAIAKISADGNSFGMNIVKEIEPESWGRSKGGNLTMIDHDKIRLSPFSYPRIIQNQDGDGYLLQTRYTYGIWKYSTADGSRNATDNGRTAMFADQPCILLFDQKSLNFNSTDFIETTYSHDKGVKANYYKYEEQLGQVRRAMDFLYVPEEGKYLLLDGSGYITDYFYFSIVLEKNWAGEANSVQNEPITSTTTKNTTITKNNSTTSSENKSCFILNDLTQEQMGGKSSVKFGLTSFRLATTYLAKGKTLEVDCDDVIVYRLKNENSSERAPGYDLFNTKGKCGQTIKLSDYWK